MFRVLPEHAERVKQALDTLAECYGYCYANDMLITLDRNTSFLEDARFMQAFNAAAADDTEKSLAWRLHVLCWFAHNSLRVDGDFVECGVFRGLSTAVVAPYLDFARQPRHWYLYDTFTGIPAEQLDPGHVNPGAFQTPGLYEAAVQRFSAYPNIRVMRGRVPEVLAEGAPAKVAFLHLDMNSSAAETAALEFFADRLQPGAFVVLDDYGWRGYREQKLSADRFFGQRGKPVMELPTGQGVVMI
jgi:O-methyltransferase